MRAVTAKVLACRAVTASSGTPAAAMAVPAPLTVSPIHSSRKFRCHSSPPHGCSLTGRCRERAVTSRARVGPVTRQVAA